MSNEEAQKILDSMCNVMPENLTGEAKKIFEAIMVIVDGRDKAYKELEEKDKIINAMAKYIGKIDDETFCDEDKYERDIEDNVIDCDEDCQECVIKYFEKQIK